MPSFPLLSDDLVRRYDTAAPRYTSYPTVPAWSGRYTAVDHDAALARLGRSAEPLSLYVHIPFCRRLCRYCGCNVIVTRDPGRVDRYLGALLREIELVAKRLGARQTLQRIHLGGGTPTFLDEEQLVRLWRGISGAFRIQPGAEVAIEIDPAGTRLEQLDLLGGLGFNRISMGVQDFDPEVQRAVGRAQTIEETAAAIARARAAGFRSVNLDLIYGLPLQRPETFARTAGQVLALSPDRIAVFSFAYLPDLKPHQRRLPAAEIPAGGRKLELLRTAHETFTDAGYRAIGIDHFARPDDELARAQAEGRLWRDFQGYTAARGIATVAVGLTGISDLGFAYGQSAHQLSDYQAAIAADRLPTRRGHWCSDEDRARRRLITDLLCNFRIDLGTDAKAWAHELAALAPLERDGLVDVSSGRIALTPTGRVFARNVAMVFDTFLAASQERPFSRAV